MSIIGTGGGSSSGKGGRLIYYIDGDGDGYGNAGVFLESASQPQGYVANDTDCDDADAGIHPGGTDIAGDGIDQDCDGFDLKSWYQDADDDGYGNPGVTITANSVPDGYVSHSNDCDDENADVFPGNMEIAHDGIDQDCDGFDLKSWFQDADGDGYGNPDVSVSEAPMTDGYVDNNADCDDTDAGIHPGALETTDDGIDQDCDGFDLKAWFQDTDKDGYGNPDITVTANSIPDGYVADNNDCDDSDAAINPGTCPPPTVFLTVNNIPAAMNGSTPYLSNTNQLMDFTLAVPTSRFTWDITVDCPCGCREDSLQAWTDPPAPSGNNLSDFFQSNGNGNYSWMVDEARAFDETEILTLNATITDKCGQPSDIASLTVQAMDMRPLLDPFDLQDPWLFVYERDHYTISSKSDGSMTVSSEAVPNGVPDFLEDLWTIGLGTQSPHPDFADVTCDGGNNGNECLARMLLERTREDAYRLFHCRPDGTRGHDGVNIRFWIENEPGAPDPNDFTYQTLTGNEEEKSFSMMGFGGGNPSSSHIGLSEHVDYRNRLNENNAKKDYGILTTTLTRYISLYLNNNFTLSLAAAIYLGDIFPPAGGKPIGALEDDVRVIDLSIPDESLSPKALSRREQMRFLTDLVVAGLSTLTVHEIGHSVGLVPPGHPPSGFFAGEKNAAFIENPEGSTNVHIDTAGLNIMQAGPGAGLMPEISSDDIEDLLDGKLISFFNEMNLAYLQGRLLLLPE